MKTNIKKIVEFYNEYPEYIGDIEVHTRHGYKTIEFADITATDSPVLTITTETGKSISSSPNHLFFHGDWKYAYKFNVDELIETCNGLEKIISIKKEKKREDLYDLQVEEVKEFYANGFVSHNSTLLDALCVVLFNKPFRKINKPQLINSINKKDCLVEVEFRINKKKYLIRRGYRPNIFEIYCNGKLINQDSTNKDYQKNLEEQILKMNYKTFTQVVILGSAGFVPFMQLSAYERRTIIEDLLDIQVFSSMNVLLKSRMVEIREKMTESAADLRVITEKFNIQKKYIQSITRDKDKLIHNYSNKIEQCEDNIKSYNEKIEKISDKIAQLEEKIESSQSVYNKHSKTLSDLRSIKGKIKTLSEDVDFFKHNKECPTCSQTISHEHSDGIISKYEATQNNLENTQNQFMDLIEKLDKKIATINLINNNINELNQKRNKISSDCSASLKYQKKLQDELNELQNNNQKGINEEKDRLKSLATDIKKLRRKKDDIIEEKEHYDIISVLLKDSGIKTKIISQYLPLINQTINKYLTILDFGVSFELDENFNEKIKSRYRDEFSYSSFSEGEKQRIDLALLFCWRDIARIRNSANTNLLILDEIFDSSLDENGTEEFMKLLYEIKRNTNIFIISHHGDALLDKFDNSLIFEKVGNFSHLTKKEN